MFVTTAFRIEISETKLSISIAPRRCGCPGCLLTSLITGDRLWDLWLRDAVIRLHEPGGPDDVIYDPGPTDFE